METEIGLFAMKRDIINRHLGHYQAVKAEVHIVQMAPLALCNYATYEILKRGGPDGIDPAAAAESSDDTPRGKKRCAVILDIGTDRTRTSSSPTAARSSGSGPSPWAATTSPGPSRRN